MPQDVFGVNVGIGGAWQIQGAVIRINGDVSDGLVVNSLRLTYNRAISRFAPLNKIGRYLATGDAVGAVDMGALIGPSTGVSTFIRQYSNPCALSDNVMTIMPTGLLLCNGQATLAQPATVPKFICHGCLLNGLTINVSEGQGGMSFIGGGLLLTFIYLEIQDVTSTP